MFVVFYHGGSPLFHCLAPPASPLGKRRLPGSFPIFLGYIAWASSPYVVERGSSAYHLIILLLYLIFVKNLNGNMKNGLLSEGPR